MQKLAEVCIKRPIFAAMIVLALVVVGAASYFRLGVDRFPSVDLPTVRIQTILPGASPEEIETFLRNSSDHAYGSLVDSFVASTPQLHPGALACRSSHQVAERRTPPRHVNAS